MLIDLSSQELKNPVNILINLVVEAAEDGDISEPFGFSLHCKSKWASWSFDNFSKEFFEFIEFWELALKIRNSEPNLSYITRSDVQSDNDKRVW